MSVIETDNDWRICGRWVLRWAIEDKTTCMQLNKSLNDWLVLTECQRVKGYFMPIEQGIAFIVRTNLHFDVYVFMAFFMYFLRDFIFYIFGFI